MNPVHAAQPAMHKAIELLEEAKTAQNPAALLEKAIAAVNSGSDAGTLIDEAIVLVREGMEIKRENKGKKKGE